MLKRDFIMVQIEELGKVIAQIIFNRNSNDGARKNPELIQSVYTFLKLDNDFLLNTPIDGIRTYLDGDDSCGLQRMELASKTLLEESFLLPEAQGKKLRARAKELLEYIQRNANRLLHLVNQLMDYRRAELGVFELKVKKENAHQLIQDNFLFYDKLARHKKITYTLHSELEDKEVLFDANYLELIVNNLLSNAFKYTESGQSITVTLKEENGWLLLQVSDTGIGIPINKQGKIFERFYQIESEHLSLIHI